MRTEEKRSVGREHSGIFRSIFRSTLIIVPVPVIITAIAVLVSLHLLEGTVEEFETQARERIMNEIELSLEDVTLTMMQTRKNEIILDYIRNDERDYYEEHRVVDALQEIIAGHNNVEEIYLYLPRTDMVFSTFYGVESFLWHDRNYSNSYEEWLSWMDSSWRGRFRIIPGADGEIKNILSGSIGEGQYNAQIVVQMDQDYLRDIAEKLCFYEGEEVFLFSANGMMMATYGEGDRKELGERVLDCVRDEDRKIQINGSSYDIRTTSSAKRNLLLVTVSPGKSNHISVLYTKIFGAFAILLSIVLLGILSYVTASKNYRPIRKINYLIKEADGTRDIRNYEDIESYVHTSAHDLQEMRRKIVRYEEDMNNLHLGRILFRGAAAPPGNALHRVLGRRYFAVLLFVFDQSGETEEELLQIGGKNVLKDILYAYVSECLPMAGAFCILEENENLYCVLNGDDREVFLGISDQCGRLKDSLAEEERISCDIFVSQIYKELCLIHAGYEEVKEKQTEALNRELEARSTEETCDVERILAYIQSNLSDQNLCAAGIADAIGMTPWQLSKLFKLKLETGVLEYIHLCRIEQAKELFKVQKQLRVKEVAESVGFCNVATFIRVFKKLTGVTPGQYKEVVDIGKE